MKKQLVCVLSLAALAVTGCGSTTASPGSSQVSSNNNAKTENSKNQNVQTAAAIPAASEESSELVLDGTSDEILSSLKAYIEAVNEKVENDGESVLQTVGEDYQTYKSNKSVVTDYYESSMSDANNLYSSIETASIAYYKAIASEGLDDYDHWNRAMEDYYKVWDRGMEDFYDAWNDEYEDIYSTCDDSISDASDAIDYDEYNDEWKDMYNAYQDVWKDMYDAYQDAWKDGYDNYQDVWNAFYKGKSDVVDILGLNKQPVSADPVGIASADITTSDSLDQIKANVEADVENTTAALQEKYNDLTSRIDTYDKYINNKDDVENFYQETVDTTKALCIRLREYSLNYAQVITSSGKSHMDQYEDLGEIYDVVYDDAGDDVYDIYDDLLGDMYDYYYAGILDDAYDGADYSQWSSARSDEYGWYSDSRSDVYDEYSDYRSDVYDFYSDMRSEVYDDDAERAAKVMSDFQSDIDKLKS